MRTGITLNRTLQGLASLLFTFIVCVHGSGRSYASEYAAAVYEAEDGALFDGATIQDCDSCSGGKQVGDLGGNNQSYFTYDVEVAEDGVYMLRLAFSSGDPRSIFISANGDSPKEVVCESGGWTTVAETALEIELHSGINTIKFFNDTGYGPNIDKFSLELIPADPGDCENCSTYDYGTDGRIVYNEARGTFDVYRQETLIIQRAYSEASNFDAVISSRDYSGRTISQSSFSDDAGAGQKIVVTLTGEDLPEMRQVFYTYPDKPFFLMEVFLEDTEILESNYMAPLISSAVTIDAAGDNRVLDIPFDNDAWVRYNAIPTAGGISNTSAEVTAFYENNSRNGLVTGSVEQTVWKTGIESRGSGSSLDYLRIWGGYASSSGTRDKVPHGKIGGNLLKSPRIFAGFFEDWREGMETYGRVSKAVNGRYVDDWGGSAPFGWNSWGSIQSDISLDKAKAVVDFFDGEIPVFRSDDTAYIDLDSYWDNLVNGGLEGDFSRLAEFVDYCKSHDLAPGIYWAPFVDWGKYERRVEGSGYNYSSTWTKVGDGYHDLDDARAMDPTHPGTRDRIDLVIDKFRQAGFEMIKIDFIGHAAAEATSFYDPDVTTGMQAFKSGMEYLLDRIGNDMLVYAAISPNLATGRYVHMRRIACDAYADINATEYTLNSTTYGWWQSEIYDYIDADHIVFGNSSIGENRARLASGIVNGSIILGDDYSTSGQWTERSRELLQNGRILDLAREGSVFVPVEGNTGQTASELFIHRSEGKYYLVVFNYGDEKTFNVNLGRLGINTGSYCITELFSGNRFSLNGNEFSASLGAKDAAVYEFNAGENSCVFSLPDNYRIRSTDVSCHGKADGKIAVEFKDPGYVYTVHISDRDPVALPANTEYYDIQGLDAGIYEICFTIDGAEDYRQCFEITVDQPGVISAVTKYDKRTERVRLSLQGAERYYVSLNGREVFYTPGEYELPLEKGLNELSVKGDLECQGTYTEKIYVSQGVEVYPNPVDSMVYITIPAADKTVTADVFDLQGRPVKSFEAEVNDSTIGIDMGNLRAGTYLIRISGGTFGETVKVMKK
ncbi:T9SS type A sorting domain-containing protein [Sinomicrobium soli]|uniref:T9SS type A sorting domain-containing protein n=1 Tax=Sinomicrobium sp. N-1-3-6 TaxID=2219864 RepID=UPI001374CEEC|nr:T9SS type A sorting domain-containing protein [Sinomicrobium sp. N-1-3-6]